MTTRAMPRCGHFATRFAPTLILAAFCAAPALATDYFVSPTASASGDGSGGNPWRLQTALNHPAAVRPGDTIWLRGGTYAGTYTSYLTGTSAAPIIVRQYPNERAKLDGGNSNGMPILRIGGGHAWYWGFEIMSSDPDRVSSTALDFPPDMGRGDGISSMTATGIKLINLVVHDTRQGISAFREWTNAEIYGSLIYYNGWQSSAGGYGHGIYTQNDNSGTKRIADNILFQQFSHGLHAYTESGVINNYIVEGNTSFMNGDLASSGSGRNLLVGGLVVAQNPIVRNNELFFTPGGPTSSLNMGYIAGCNNPNITNNYVADNTRVVNCLSGPFTGNFFYGTTSGFNPSQYPGNTYTTQRPTGVRVVLRPNEYEPGRANITIYNWSQVASTAVNVSGLLQTGDAYEIRNAQNFFGPPVLSGTYSGVPINVPLGALPAAAPVGWPTPLTSPDFQSFILIRLLGPHQFLDVSSLSPYYPFVTSLSENGVTSGCALFLYCPTSPVLRSQMAVFLLRSKFGPTYNPPPATGTVFTDVSAGSFAAAWIERLAALGITSGCGSGKYCPNSSVTRDQMAVFLLLTRNGSGYTPPAATGIFTDVPVSSPYARWIEQLYRDGLTVGCGGGIYCPAATVSRGDMAVFLVETFALP
jgi:hypothetical protein